MHVYHNTCYTIHVYTVICIIIHVHMHWYCISLVLKPHLSIIGTRESCLSYPNYWGVWLGNINLHRQVHLLFHTVWVQVGISFVCLSSVTGKLVQVKLVQPDQLSWEKWSRTGTFGPGLGDGYPVAKASFWVFANASFSPGDACSG